jgi:hypothetical protein
VGNVEVYDNPALPSCQAEELVTQLAEFGGAAEIYRNDEDALCE